MNLAILIDNFRPHTGGGERQMEGLGAALAKRGMRVSVVTRRYEGLAAREEFGDIEVHRLSLPAPRLARTIGTKLYRFLSGGLFPLCAIRHLAKCGRRPQVVLVQSGLAFNYILRITGAAAVAGALTPTTKVILKPWLKPCPHSEPMSGLRLLRPDEDCTSRLRNRVYAFVRRHTDAFVAITEAIGQDLARDNILDQRIRQIPNGVDADTFRPVDPEAKQLAKQRLNLTGKRVVTYLGHLNPAKGLSVLLDAWQQVSADANAHLLLVGRTRPEAQFDALVTQAHMLDIGDSLTFIGEQQDVRPYLDAADVFVLPSFREGMSNALLEGMSYGLPVVTTDCPGMEDVVTNDVNAVVVPVGNAVSLAAGLSRLLSSPALAKRLGDAARQTILQRFSFDVVAEQYETLFQSLNGHR